MPDGAYTPPLVEPYKPRALSERMKGVLQRVLDAEDHTTTIGPGHDFQTCISLTNRGYLTAFIGGEPPKQHITVTLTHRGEARARTLRLVEIREIRQTVNWPFPFSSRGYHLPGPLPGTK